MNVGYLDNHMHPSLQAAAAPLVARTPTRVDGVPQGVGAAPVAPPPRMKIPVRPGPGRPVM